MFSYESNTNEVSYAITVSLISQLKMHFIFDVHLRLACFLYATKTKNTNSIYIKKKFFYVG